MVEQHKGNEHQRILQKKLAEEVTTFVHSRKDYEFAVKASSILFNNDTAEILKELNEEQLLQVMEGVPTVEIEKGKLNELDLVSLLTETKIIHGLNCRKATLAGDNGSNLVEMWYAEDIPMPLGFYGLADVPGLMVEGEMISAHEKFA